MARLMQIGLGIFLGSLTGGGGSGGGVDNLLLETGDAILLETGDVILTE